MRKPAISVAITIAFFKLTALKIAFALNSFSSLTIEHLKKSSATAYLSYYIHNLARLYVMQPSMTEDG